MQITMVSKISTLIVLTGLNSVVIAATSPDLEFYGKAFLTVQNTEEGAADRTELLSNASRFGFKGTSKLDGGLSIIYQAEYETDMDEGNPVFSQRNIYAGISGGFGTLLAGKHDTPTKMTQNKIDLFNDLSGDIRGVFKGENRPSNIIMYSTNDLGGVKVNVAGVLSEKNATPPGAPVVQEDGLSLSGVYTQNKLYLALGIDHNVGSSTSQLKTGTNNIIRLVGQYTLNDFIFGALVQNSEKSNPNPAILDDDKAETGVFASAAYKWNKLTFKAQVGLSDELVVGGEQLSLGADYKLGAKTRVFGFYTDRGADAAANENNYIGVGLEHDF